VAAEAWIIHCKYWCLLHDGRLAVREFKPFRLLPTAPVDKHHRFGDASRLPRFKIDWRSIISDKYYNPFKIGDPIKNFKYHQGSTFLNIMNKVHV
jgi:hypothetical protein